MQETNVIFWPYMSSVCPSGILTQSKAFCGFQIGGVDNYVLEVHLTPKCSI